MHDTTSSSVPAVSITQEDDVYYGNTKPAALRACALKADVDSPETPNDSIDGDIGSDNGGVWQHHQQQQQHQQMHLSKPDVYAVDLEKQQQLANKLHESVISKASAVARAHDTSDDDTNGISDSTSDTHVSGDKPPKENDIGQQLQDPGSTAAVPGEQTNDSTTGIPSATAEAMETYVHLTTNMYLGQATGKSVMGVETMPCECKYNPAVDDSSNACGDDNKCINRMMLMECTESDCPCGRACLNRRFQLCQYARVDVIKVGKKGYGLRALADLPADAFVIEYIGEVITNKEFARRTKRYEAEGVKHHYFMTLKTDELIDATKKGCLARFINHSCNPNCATEKWVVGKSMRIGIFTRRPIKAGEELTFDYQFEQRNGTVAQECHCGEENCKGFIGDGNGDEASETSSVAVSDESDDESQDDEDDAVKITAKKKPLPVKRRNPPAPPKPLSHDAVRTFVIKMADSDKVHVVKKLLQTLEVTSAQEDGGKDALKMFVRLRGLKMLKIWLGQWKANNTIVEKVLRVLKQLPLAHRNGLEDCEFFQVMERLSSHDNAQINTLAKDLLTDWSQLKSVYRIPKRVTSEPEHSPVQMDADGDVIMTNKHASHDTDKKPRYSSTREHFDPDNDLFEYIAPNADAGDIYAALHYPPTAAPPTAPRGHFFPAAYHGPVSRRPCPNVWDRNDHHARPNHGKLPHSPIRRTRVYAPPRQYTSYYDRRHHYHYRHRSTSPPPLPAAAPPSAHASKLPSNWKQARTEDGQVYYYNRVTRATQWTIPEEKISTIEGVDQSQIDTLVEQAMQHKKPISNGGGSNSSIGGGSSSRSSAKAATIKEPSSKDNRDRSALDKELKQQVSMIVRKRLSTKPAVWNNDKALFKELARKMTHHVLDREARSSRKLDKIDDTTRAKIEKLIDAHGADFAKRCSSGM